MPARDEHRSSRRVRLRSRPTLAFAQSAVPRPLRERCRQRRICCPRAASVRRGARSSRAIPWRRPASRRRRRAGESASAAAGGPPAGRRTPRPSPRGIAPFGARPGRDLGERVVHALVGDARRRERGRPSWATGGRGRACEIPAASIVSVPRNPRTPKTVIAASRTTERRSSAVRRSIAAKRRGGWPCGSACRTARTARSGAPCSPGARVFRRGSAVSDACRWSAATMASATTDGSSPAPTTRSNAAR